MSIMEGEQGTCCAWLVGQTNADTFKISALTAYTNVDRLKQKHFTRFFFNNVCDGRIQGK